MPICCGVLASDKVVPGIIVRPHKVGGIQRMRTVVWLL